MVGLPKMPFTLAPEELYTNKRMLLNLKDDVQCQADFKLGIDNLMLAISTFLDH